MQQQQQGPEDDELSALERFCTDVTDEAKRGLLDPLVGREEEVRRLIHILCRRTKNNPVLLGQSGVGKTAIVEGLAQRIVNDDVPHALRGARLLEVDLGAVGAGCQMPGEFEERLTIIVQEVVDASAKGPVVLFIDDIHNLCPAPPMNNNGAAILKPALGRGLLRCVGATSADKFKKTIEQDAALERRFQVVTVEEPSVDDTVSILRGLRPRYEQHHSIAISEGALLASAQLSARYVSGRQLPDKAIDLLDEAAAAVRMSKTSKPDGLDMADRRIAQLQKEREQLLRKNASELTKAGTSNIAAAELQKIAHSLSIEKKGRKEMQVKFETERRVQDEYRRAFANNSFIKRKVENAKMKIEQASKAEPGSVLAAELTRAEAELKKLEQQMRVTQDELTNAEAGVLELKDGGAMIREEVTDNDVAAVVSRWTGVPVAKLVSSEKAKLLQLESELHQRVIGQEAAVTSVAEAVQRSRADLADPNGPVASFMFLGPTGVGKTELAKALANYLFNSDTALVRLDMSEYMEKHSVARLIGAPPGYVGYDEGGMLTDAVRQKPYSVVLFDEIEKAHVDVFNVLLQLLDEGHVTDTQGRNVSFRNCLIIMTSNLGSDEISYANKRRNKVNVKDAVMQHVRSHFRPEFVNRIDEFIVFEPLTHAQIEEIVQLQTKKLSQRIEGQRMNLSLDKSAVEHLARMGYDPAYGARPVRRAIQRELIQPLANAMLRGVFNEDDTILVTADREGICLSNGPKIVRELYDVHAEDSEDESAVSSSAPRTNGFNGVIHSFNGMM
ncbi:ClpA/B, conserved site 2 [Ostreococcus tauri]|nr:ClpA/B, conserved site 2 [Ostreococcus tauri]CEF96515.1 ClpA/B, conserved site 2 [Ostreococcus tauri]|eukprot:XP_003074131.2 ClpA/B, conserved site 2 [Ostreococcus tauri]